jgi:gliding motility-associated-like protein
MYSCTNLQGTFHIVLYESTNIIENHIQSKPNCPGWALGTAVQGVHNLPGTIGIAVPGRNSTQWTTQNNSHRWTPSGAPVPAVLTWYQVGNPVAIGTGPTITVTPPPAGANYTCHFVYPVCNAGWAACNVGIGNLGPDTVFVAPGPPNLPPPNVVAVDPHCNAGCDGTILITPNGGTGVITISWGLPGTNFSQINLCAGAYSYNLIDAAGCTYNSVVTLNNPPPLTPPVVVGTDPICFGDCNGQAIANPTSGVGPYTYAWSNGQSTANTTLLCSGTYSVTVLDVWNCPATGSVILTNPPITTISAITGSDTVCFGSTLDLYTVVPQPGYAYVWSTVGIPVSGQGTNTYGVDWSAESPGYAPGAVQVIAYNAVGCSSMPAVFDLTIFNAVPVIDPMGPYCAVDGCETLSALPSGGAFSINGSPVTQFCPQNNGSFDTVVYTYTQSGCSFDDSLSFTVNLQPSITSILPDNTFAELCDGDTLGLTYVVTSTLPGSVTWDINGNSINGGYTLNTTWDSFGTFLISAVITTAEGCTSQSATALLTIQECPNTLIYIPNTFTPDGDERNQTWAPVFTSGFNPSQFLLSVFNRWGNIIWESRSPVGEWDGMYNDSPCQSGIYTYKVWYGDPKTDAKYLLTGMITLIR